MRNVLFCSLGNMSQERYWCIEMSVICIHCGSEALVLSLNSELQSVVLMVRGVMGKERERQRFLVLYDYSHTL